MVQSMDYLVIIILFIVNSHRVWSTPKFRRDSDDDSAEGTWVPLPPASDVLWNYGADKGPAKWASMFPYQCAGTHQSPISIQTTATERQELGMLQLAGYSERAGRKMTLANIGHTVGLLLEGNYTLHGGGLPSVYVADQIHFHWGRSDSRGSEHVLDRRKYPAEMHIVHHDVSMSRDRTIHTPGGLAVLAVLMEIGEENKAFDEIVNRLPDVQFKDEATPMRRPISVADLLPRNTDRFYRYAGSLTTPPCNEVVTWTVFQEPITISRNQLSALRRLYETTRPSYLYNRRQRPRPLSDNFRPPQQLNGRRVYRNGF